MAERAAKATAEIEALGGEEGVEVGKLIVPHVLSGKADDETCNAIFDGIAEANPQALARMGQMFVTTALEDERTGAAFADQLLQEEYGEGYTAEKIARLVELDKAGLIDADALSEDLGAVRQPTARERELEAQVKERDARLKELSGDKDAQVRKEAERLQTTVRASISQAVMARVTPIADSIGWQGEGLLARLGALAAAEMNAEIERSPEFDAITELAESGRAFDRDGKPTRLMRVKLEAIGRRGEAMFLKTARELKPVVQLLAEQQKKPTTRKPAADKNGRSSDPPPRREEPQAPSAKPKTTEEGLEAIRERHRKRVQDAQAFAG